MEEFFAFSELKQSIIVSSVSFAVVAVFLVPLFYFLLGKKTDEGLKFGVAGALAISIIVGAGVYFLNDKIFGYYLQNYSGPRMMSEAKAFGAKPDEVLRVIMMNHKNGSGKVSLNSIKEYKGRVHLTGKQAERFFNVYKACFLEQLVRPKSYKGSERTDVQLFGPFSDYPITPLEMTNYINRHHDMLDPDSGYRVVFPADYRFPQDKLEMAVRKSNYIRPNRLCFSGKEIDYILYVD